MELSVEQILKSVGGRLANAEELGSRASGIRVSRPFGLGKAASGDLAYFFSKEYISELKTAKPGVLITGDAFIEGLKASGLPLWKESAVVACSDPYLAMATLSEQFADLMRSNCRASGYAVQKTEIHPTAVVDPSAELGEGVRIGPFCVVEAKVRIGRGTRLVDRVSLGQGAQIGAEGLFFSGVVIYEWTQIGDRARIHAGTVIGSDGFGYAPVRESGKISDHRKIYHVGRVRLGDDVEIGANSCVDRSTFGETVIESRAKLDNHVHIGHNAFVAEGAILCGGVCLAGGAKIGKFAYVGGLTGVTNRVEVGDGAQVGALSLVTKDVPPQGTAVGNPQRDYREHFRVHAHLNRMSKRGKE